MYKISAAAYKNGIVILLTSNTRTFDPLNLDCLHPQVSLNISQVHTKKVKKQFQSFLKERIFSSERPILHRIKKNGRCNFITQEKPKGTASANQMKTSVMENKAMVGLVTLAQQGQLDLIRIMQYRLKEVPLALFNVNSTLRKTVKAKLVDVLILEDVK